MLPISFVIENFKTHKYTEIDCTQFESVVIIARNKNNPRRANGAGKSTIFEAIDFALFNYADVNLEKVVRFGTDKCRVVFTFETSQNTYRITRSRTKSGKADLKLEHLLNGSWSDITAKTASETEEEIAKIVRISHVAFRSSILFAQNDMHGLAAARPAERKLLLKEPLQLAEYSKYEKKAKEKNSVLTKEYDAIKTKISGLGDPMSEVTESQAKIVTVKQAIIDNDDLIKIHQKKLDDFKLEIATLQASEKSDNFQEELETLKKNKSGLNSKLQAASISKKHLEDQQLASNNKITAAIRLIEAHRARRKELEAVSLRDKAQIEVDIAGMVTKEIDGKVYLGKLNDAKIKLQKPITSADLCESCEQPVTADHRKSCEELRLIKLQKNTEDLEKYSKLLETVKSKKKIFETELAQLEKHTQTLSDLDTQILLQSNIVDSEKPQIEDRKTRIETSATDLAVLQASVEEISAKIIGVEAKIEESLKVSKKYILDRLQTETETAAAEIQNIRDQNTNLTLSVGSLTQKIESRTNDFSTLQSLAEQKKNLEVSQNRLQRIIKGFSPSGIPSMIINTILDDLQINTNDLLSQIRPEVEAVFSIVKTKEDGKQEDTLDIFYRVHGKPHEYKQLSGGQKVMVSFCLKLALSLVIQHRIGVDIKFLELDEVDMSFDDEGLEAFVEIIKKWQKKLKIMLISHNKYVQSKFTQAILVESEDRFCSSGKLVSL